MSYSDEPNLISEQKRSKKIYFLIGGVLLFILLLASVAFYPRLLDFQRRNTAVGPNDGSLYFISFEQGRYSMELARSEERDFQLAVYIHPVREETEWQPEEHVVRVRPKGQDAFLVLEWEEEEKFFGPSEPRFHPAADVQFEIEIERGSETVWSGRRWSFRLPTGGHGH